MAKQEIKAEAVIPARWRTICGTPISVMGLALAGTLAMLAIAAASSHAAVTIGSNLAGDPEATINCPRR